MKWYYREDEAARKLKLPLEEAFYAADAADVCRFSQNENGQRVTYFNKIDIDELQTKLSRELQPALF